MQVLSIILKQIKHKDLYFYLSLFVKKSICYSTLYAGYMSI